MSKSKKHYTEEFKLTVLKDKYANHLSIYSAAKKIRNKIKHLYMRLGKRSIRLTLYYYLLSNEVITRVQAMQKGT